MGNPMVSVIIPVFNGGRFLAESIRSVLEQPYRPLEILVVDDGSTDDSRAVAERMAAQHHSIRVLRQPVNGGPAQARNAALGVAQGPLITFLDADDRMSGGRISFQVAYLAHRPHLGGVIGRQKIVVEPGAELPGWLREPGEEQPRHYPMSLMARRALFEQVGSFDARLRVGSDADWLSRAKAAKVRIGLVDRIMVYRRIPAVHIRSRAPGLAEAFPGSSQERIAERLAHRERIA